MKQQKLSDYKPNYPKKAMRRAALAAAALLAIGSTVGCKAQNLEPEISGAIAIDEPGVEICTPTPTPPMTMGTSLPVPDDEPPMTTGLPLITPEPTEIPAMTTGIILLTPEPEEEEITLLGDVMVDEQP